MTEKQRLEAYASDMDDYAKEARKKARLVRFQIHKFGETPEQRSRLNSYNKEAAQYSKLARNYRAGKSPELNIFGGSGFC